jgi:hypothetical protein
MRHHQGQRWKKGSGVRRIRRERVNPAKSVKSTSRQLPCRTFRLLELRHADDEIQVSVLVSFLELYHAKLVVQMTSKPDTNESVCAHSKGPMTFGPLRALQLMHSFGAVVGANGH